MLKVKTIGKNLYYSSSPDGGGGWVVLIAAFFIYGNAFGMSKSLGIYFLEIKHEFEVSNSETSWILSLFLGALGLAGLFTSCLPSWIDARKLIMFGGLMAGCGMILSAFSPIVWLVYLGSFLAGIGHGIAYVSVTAQISLYFSTLRPLATGIMLSGSSVCSTVLPYFNQFLLEKFGWRGSFWILAAVSFNTCVLGALVRPIENVSVNNSNALVMEDGDVSEEVRVAKPVFEQILSFFSSYWVAFCLLFANVLLDLFFYVPIVFLVPYAQSVDVSPNDAAILLSFISIGDIVCRPLNGFLMARFKFLLNHLLLYLAALNVMVSLYQVMAVFSASFTALIIYTLFHGCLHGFLTTATVTSVPTLMGTKNISKMYGIFFAGGSFSILASAPLAGIFVDVYNDYKVAYWYCVIGFGITGMFCLIMYLIVKTRGGVVLRAKS